jgi:hypothetical protein
MARQRILVPASAAFVAANLLHTLDHLRQGTDRLTTEVFAGGSVLTVAALVALYLALRRDPRAPLTAAVVGLWTAVGVAASHIAPHWSAFSDPYPDLHVDVLSWAVMLGEIAAALVLGVVGLRELRRQGTVGSWLSSST